MTFFHCTQCGQLVTKNGCMVWVPPGSEVWCERLKGTNPFAKPKPNPELDAFLAAKGQAGK